MNDDSWLNVGWVRTILKEYRTVLYYPTKPSFTSNKLAKQIATNLADKINLAPSKAEKSEKKNVKSLLINEMSNGEIYERTQPKMHCILLVRVLD